MNDGDTITIMSGLTALLMTSRRPRSQAEAAQPDILSISNSGNEPNFRGRSISPLVIKASAGTLFKIPIYFCNTLEEVLPEVQDANIYALSLEAKNSLYDLKPAKKSILVLGNESEGVSKEVHKLCND